MPYIFEKEKMLFVHLPKCGGIFIVNYLKNLGFEKDNAQASDNKWFIEQHDHFKHFDREKYKDFFKFTSVRNPFSRLVSAYYFNKLRIDNVLTYPLDSKDRRTQKYSKHYKSFDTFIDFIYQDCDNMFWSGYITPMSDILYDFENGKFLLDFYIKLEDKKKGLREVCAKNNIAFSENDERIDKPINSIKNQVLLNGGIKTHHHNNVSDYYKKERTMYKFMDLYERDFDVFCYSKDLSDIIIPEIRV